MPRGVRPSISVDYEHRPVGPLDDAFGDAAEKPAGDTAAREPTMIKSTARERASLAMLSAGLPSRISVSTSTPAPTTPAAASSTTARLGELGTQRTLVVRVS